MGACALLPAAAGRMATATANASRTMQRTICRLDAAPRGTDARCTLAGQLFTVCNLSALQCSRQGGPDPPPVVTFRRLLDNHFARSRARSDGAHGPLGTLM